MPRTKIFIIRHAQTEGNIKNLFGGNPDLTQKGREQVKEVAQNLPLETISTIYSSKLKRALETAEIIKTCANIAHEIIPRKNLRERHFGNLENMSILQKHSDIHNKALAKDHDLMWDVHLTTDDETLRESFDRFYEEIRKITTNHLGQSILVVSHGSIMRSLLVHLGYGNFHQLRGGSLKNLGTIELEFTEGKISLADVKGVQFRK